jgi:hypothetical protein
MADERHWRIIEIPVIDDAEVSDAPRPTDLTDGELLGISVLLTHHPGGQNDDFNVYWRARQKIQPQIKIVLEEQQND